MIQTRIGALRNKFFLLLGAVIIIIIFFIAITNNIQTHEKLLQKIEKLELQNEEVNKQVEVEKDQIRERNKLYEKIKNELNQKLKEQQEIHEKENHETVMRINSLQQQYKILGTKHDDCTAELKELSTENDELKRKLAHVQAENLKIQTSKDNDIAVCEMKYKNLEKDIEKLQSLLKPNEKPNNVQSEDEHQQLLQLKYKNYKLKQEIKDLEKKLHISQGNQSPAPEINKNNNINNNKAIDKSFQEQIPVSDDHYKIPINIRNKSKSTNVIIPEQNVVDSKNVLQQPGIISNGKTTSTTPTSVIKSGDNKKNQENLAIPNNNWSTSSVNVGSTTTKSSRKLPKFVLPIPDLKNDDNELHKEPVKEADKKQILDETLNKPQNEDINEIENGAHEINDNDFNIEEKNQKNFDNIDPDKNIVNNAAEEFDVHKPVDSKKVIGNEEMDLEIINRPANGANVKDKLKDEIANDHGKEDAYPEEDLHLEQLEEDLGDIGEYDDPNALRNQGVAERN